MGVSDGMEDGLMDDEIRDALAMTKEELLARAAKGEPADVARSNPRERTSTASESGAIRIYLDVSSIVVRRGHLDEQRSVRMEPPSVTISR